MAVSKTRSEVHFWVMKGALPCGSRIMRYTTILDAAENASRTFFRQAIEAIRMIKRGHVYNPPNDVRGEVRFVEGLLPEAA